MGMTKVPFTKSQIMLEIMGNQTNFKYSDIFSLWSFNNSHYIEWRDGTITIERPRGEVLFIGIKNKLFDVKEKIELFSEFNSPSKTGKKFSFILRNKHGYTYFVDEEGFLFSGKNKLCKLREVKWF